MPPLADFFRHPWVLIAAAAVLLYVGARAAADALRFGSAARLAGAHWLPIAAFVGVAAARGEFAAALAVLLASSVACLSLVPGATLLQQTAESPAGSSSAGLLLPAVAMLIFLAGIRVQFTLFHAAALAIVGAAAVFCLRGPPAGEPGPTSKGPPRVVGVLQLLLSVGITVAGGVVALVAAKRAAEASTWASLPLVSAVLLSPLLVLPLLGVSADLAARGRAAFALEAQRRVLLLNLCLLLPGLILVAHSGLVARSSTAAVAGPALAPTTTPTTSPTTVPTTAPASVDADDTAPAWPTIPLPFPMGLWRVDAVALVILSLYFLPAAQGRWALSKVEGAGLVIGYLGYLILTLMTQLDLGFPPISELVQQIVTVFFLLLHHGGHGG